MSESHLSAPEAERQLGAAIARHRELVASSAQGGRSATSDSAAAAAAARGAALVAFALRRARAAGVNVERLADLSEWEPEIVEDALERGPEPVLELALPGGVEPDAVARARATLDELGRIDRLLERISADVVDPEWTPTTAELDELRVRLERQWSDWRTEHGRSG